MTTAQISRGNPVTGEIKEIKIDATEEEMLRYCEGVPAEEAFSNLSPEAIEFFKSGLDAESGSDAIQELFRGISREEIETLLRSPEMLSGSEEKEL